MGNLPRIHALLDEASRLADDMALEERYAHEPYTQLRKNIDFALARAEALLDPSK